MLLAGDVGGTKTRVVLHGDKGPWKNHLGFDEIVQVKEQSHHRACWERFATDQPFSPATTGSQRWAGSGLTSAAGRKVSDVLPSTTEFHSTVSVESASTASAFPVNEPAHTRSLAGMHIALFNFAEELFGGGEYDCGGRFRPGS